VRSLSEVVLFTPREGKRLDGPEPASQRSPQWAGRHRRKGLGTDGRKRKSLRFLTECCKPATSVIRHRLVLQPLSLREAISQHEVIVDGIGLPCPMQNPRIRKQFDLSRPRSVGPPLFSRSRAGSSCGPGLALLHEPRIPSNSATECNVRHTPPEKSVV
jgi:hypothetical protein